MGLNSFSYLFAGKVKVSFSTNCTYRFLNSIRYQVLNRFNHVRLYNFVRFFLDISLTAKKAVIAFKLGKRRRISCMQVGIAKGSKLLQKHAYAM